MAIGSRFGVSSAFISEIMRCTRRDCAGIGSAGARTVAKPTKKEIYNPVYIGCRICPRIDRRAKAVSMSFGGRVLGCRAEKILLVWQTRCDVGGLAHSRATYSTKNVIAALSRGHRPRLAAVSAVVPLSPAGSLRWRPTCGDACRSALCHLGDACDLSVCMQSICGNHAGET